LEETYDNVFVIPSMWCSWGGFSLVEAMVGLTHRAVRIGGNWSHLVFLSEQHLPLVSLREISNTLETDTSYVDCWPFRDIGPQGKQYLIHRFVAEYREVPGVGGFRVKPREPAADFLDGLWHGSQWIVLSRPACELLSHARHDPFWDIFKTSLLPDETAIQTWFGQSDDPAIGKNIRRNLTFVATPSAGGSDNMIFGEANFFAAIEKGYLFIRKRPDILPLSVREHLDRLIPSASSIRVPQKDTSVRVSLGHPEYLVDAVMLCLNGALKAAGSGVILVQMPRTVLGPPLFCIAKGPTNTDRVSTFVLSSDLSSFKIVAVLNDWSGEVSSSTLGPYDTTLLQVRAHAMAFGREIHLGEDLLSGFATVASIDDLVGLASMIGEFVKRSSELAAL
jgi:hypothetical protein